MWQVPNSKIPRQTVIYKHEIYSKTEEIRHPYLQLVTWGGWRRRHSFLKHSYRRTAGDASNMVVWSSRWKMIFRRIQRHAKLISIRKYLVKLVSACKWTYLVCCRERPADEYGTSKVPDGQEYTCRRVAHRQPSTADAARRMRSAHSSWSCGRSVPAQCKSFTTSRFITPASVHLVRGSNFVSVTVYPGRFNGITQVIQIAYIRTVYYKYTYIQTYSTYIHTYIQTYSTYVVHTRFHFHQCLEHIVIVY
jgi:hypothetical protein